MAGRREGRRMTIQASGLTRTFPNGSHAFRDLTFDVAQGEVLGILGTSGCGKSSLLRVLAGLDPAEGTLTLDGAPITGLSRQTGIVFQEPRLFPWLTIENNIAMGLKTLKVPREEKAQRVRSWLQEVGLSGFEKLYPKECSGGMAQRAALARCLVAIPEILILDEPFSALDAFTRMQLQDVLLDIWNELKSTLILVTHDIDEALYLCDRILVLRGQPGVLVAELRIEQSKPRYRGDADLARTKSHIIDLLNLNSHRPQDLSFVI
jgi:sulfonate transport system ATP-binding protein